MFLICVTVFLFLLALSTNKLKPFNQIFLFIIMVFLALMFGFVESNPDYEAYRKIYELQRGISETGYLYLCRICYYIGIPYPAFRFLLAFCGLGLFWHSMNLLQLRDNYFWLLYMLFPYFIDTVQIRNFIAGAVVCYAVVLLSQDVRHKYIKYIVLILLATSVHNLSIAYLILPLAIFLRKYVMLNQLYKILLVFIVVIILNREWFNNIFSYLVDIVGAWNKKIFYYDEIMTRRGYIYYWTVELLMLFFLCYLQGFRFRGRKKVSIVQEENHLSISKKKFPEFILWANLVMLVYMPVYIVRSEYFRLYRNFMPLNYMAILLLLKDKDISKQKRRVTSAVLTVIMITIFYIEYIRNDLFDKIVLNLFQNSWLNLF